MLEVTPRVEEPSTTPTARFKIGLITSAEARTIPCSSVDLSTFACATCEREGEGARGGVKSSLFSKLDSGYPRNKREVSRAHLIDGQLLSRDLELDGILCAA
jgi:hypothetical protein